MLSAEVERVGENERWNTRSSSFRPLPARETDRKVLEGAGI